MSLSEIYERLSKIDRNLRKACGKGDLTSEERQVMSELLGAVQKAESKSNQLADMVQGLRGKENEHIYRT